MLLAGLLGCGHTKAGPAVDESRSAAGRGGSVAAATGWSRAEWLRAAEGFIADPRTMPRLSDPATRPVFEQLVSTKAWLKLDGADFERSAEEIFRFYPAIKQLTRTLQSLGAIDELVALGLYSLDVHRATIVAGADFVSGLPADDTRLARLQGIDTMRLGAAISLCSALYLAMDASPASRAALVAKLTAPASYAEHSSEGLQLIAATLDERLLPSARPELQASYRAIRAVVAQQVGKDSAPSTTTHTTYQGLGPTNLPLAAATPIVSTTGHFSVVASPAATAKRVEIQQPDGTVGVQHWIEWLDGETRYEAACFDGKAEASFVAAFQGSGWVATPGAHPPGAWFTITAGGRDGRLRTLTIGGRGCIASVEGPVGQVPSAQADAFLRSLQPAP